MDEETRKEIDVLLRLEVNRHEKAIVSEEQYTNGYNKAVEDVCKIILAAIGSQKRIFKEK